jgi:hypothetical protein
LRTNAKDDDGCVSESSIIRINVFLSSSRSILAASASVTSFDLPRAFACVGAGSRFSQASAVATQCLQKAPSDPTGQLQV